MIGWCPGVIVSPAAAAAAAAAAAVAVAAIAAAAMVIGVVEDDDKSNVDDMKRLALFLSLRLDLFINVEVCLLVRLLFNVYLLINGL